MGSAAVRKHGFQLYEGDHVGHAFHDLVAGKRLAGVVHHFFHGLSGTGAFERRGGDDGHRLGMIEFQPFFPAALCHFRQGQHHEFVDFSRGKVHGTSL